ncbi:hypothetical protein Fcan01_20787 [Folsomia candida]|uniref:Uncharacterized protein n=1 Tax=Folsomia candida TaxID=158441 RepID=A0A226DH85_FOLCA|nr:hypothetical protein Fcan01_20787 [Folsomia candida]
MEAHKKCYFSLLGAVRELHNLLRSIKVAIPGSATSTTTTGSSTPQQGMRLPKLEIQPYHGDYLEWSTFKDTFEAAVHSNNQLSKVQKFGYLKSFLKGEAARYIADLTLTDSHYDIAWNQLHDRYQNKRKIVLATLDRFFSHPKTTGTAKSLKSLIDATNRCIRSMELMGYKKDKSIEPIYVHQILSKLDPGAKDLWEHTLKDKDMPSFDELCEFLERHASALDENPQQQNKPKVNVYHTQTQQPVNKCMQSFTSSLQMQEVSG